MTIKELMNAYDIELNVQSEIKAVNSVNLLQPSRSFVHAIPNKVPRSIGMRVAAGLMSAEKECTLNEDASECTILHANLECGQDDDSDVDMVFSGLSIEDLASTIVLDVAARLDDDEAEAEDWLAG